MLKRGGSHDDRYNENPSDVGYIEEKLRVRPRVVFVLAYRPTAKWWRCSADDGNVIQPVSDGFEEPCRYPSHPIVPWLQK